MRQRIRRQGTAERDDGGDVNHAARAAAHHAGKRRTGQAGDGADVDVDEGINGLRLDLDERAVPAEARVVDQQRKRLVGGDPLLNLRQGLGVGEIGGEHLGLRLRLPTQPLGQRLQALTPPGDEHDTVTIAGQPLGLRRADAGRCPGDECARSGTRTRHSPSLLAPPKIRPSAESLPVS
jgi:hypothetical protein